MGAVKGAHASSNDSSRKRSSHSRDVSAAKRQRKEVGAASKKKQSQDGGERNLPTVSILQEERKPFARGGGGVLSPFELKNIQRQAQQDVMFEETGQKSSRTRFDSEDDEMDDPEERKQIKMKAKKAKPNKTSFAKEPAEPHIRAQALTPKRMNQGDTVLARISRIARNELILDLPNNLTGHVPLTAISSKLSARLGDLMNDDDDRSDNEVDEDEDIEDIDIKKMFTIGQYLRASLLGEDDKDNSRARTKQRRRLFSLDPQLTNKGIDFSSLPTSASVMAAVRSVEDNGLVMDLGLVDDQVKGFMGKTEIPDGLNISEIQEGTVFLCLIIGLKSGGKLVQLSANHKKVGDTKKGNVLQDASTVGSFLPGTAAEVLVSQVTETTIVGKILGSVDATVDVLHSGAHFDNVNLATKFPVGSKMKGRIIYSCGDEGHRILGLSILRHVMALATPTVSQAGKSDAESPLQKVPIGSIWEQAKVVQVEAGLGLYVDIGVRGLAGFVHISRVSDSRIADLTDNSSSFKTGSLHTARVMSYSSLDNLILMSMEKTVLEQPFIRLEDIPIGQLVKGTVDQIVVRATGVTGVVLSLASGITGFVPEMHMSDIHLQHPERKFRPGVTFTARVLSINTSRRVARLTLKKSLVNTDLSIWTEYSQIKPESQAAGTISKLTKTGAILQFYGKVKAFLPASQMSDTYVEDPTTHFQVGQVLRVRTLTVDPNAKRMTVSCRLPSEDETVKLEEFRNLKLGQIIKGSISSKSEEDITIDLNGTDLTGTLRLGHFSDGSEQKNASILKHFRIGQTLSDLVIIELFDKKMSVILSNKPSLIRASKTGLLATSFDQLTVGATLSGFVRNITDKEVFVQSSGEVIGLLPKSQILDYQVSKPKFGFHKDDSVSARVLSVDSTQRRFILTMKEEPKQPQSETEKPTEKKSTIQAIVNPVDGISTSVADYSVGKVTKARITSIKETQLNVHLADNLQGRIDVSEAFSSWDDFKNRRHPLRSFSVKQELPVRVIGLHDARNHRFLPLTHRTTTMAVFELTTKVDSTDEILSYENIAVGSAHMAFVNSVQQNCLWVNLSPQVRGRISRMDASDNVSSLQDLQSSFPIGSALRTRVKAVDATKKHLDLTARTGLLESNDLTIDQVTLGSILPGRITKVTERALTVQLSRDVVGLVPRTEIADDLDETNPTFRQKDDVVRVAVLEVDQANKKITLSTRPSKVLSSSLPIKDPSITNLEQLKVGDVVRGIIKNVAEMGLFVTISYRLTAFVRVSDLSDAFIKDWKSQFEIDRIVTGRITAIDESKHHMQMSLKESVTSPDYVAPLSFNDVKVGQVLTGKVRKVEDFGAFIVIDNSQNVSGLCHRSEIADYRVPDVQNLYSEGDKVKTIVLKIESEKRRISLGLKASYFNVDPGNTDGDSESEHGGVPMTDPVEEDLDEDSLSFDLDSSEKDDADIFDDDLDEAEEDEESDSDSADDMNGISYSNKTTNGIDPGSFDWSGTAGRRHVRDDDSESEEDKSTKPSKPKKKGVNIQVDRTAALNEDPKTDADFERELLTKRDDSELWIKYMAHHLGLGEIEEARKIADRALRPDGIHIIEQGEKQNVWVAWLNLELEQGTQDTLDDVFKRACESQDKAEMHERLASIYISSSKSNPERRDKADEVYQTMIKRKLDTQRPSFWSNYAHFLLTDYRDLTEEKDAVHASNHMCARARELLDRAMQSVSEREHLNLIKSFAILHFKTSNSGAGHPELGRTLFEGLHDLFPKRGDLWDVRLEMEMIHGSPDTVRALFERMVNVKGLKPRRAKYVFKKWLEWEEKHGGPKMVEKVKAKTAEWVKKKQTESVLDDKE